MGFIIVIGLATCFVGGAGVAIFADASKWRAWATVCCLIAGFHLFSSRGALAKFVAQESPKNLAKIEAKGWKITGEVEVNSFGVKGGKVKLISKKENGIELRAILDHNDCGNWFIGHIEANDGNGWRQVTN